MVAGCISTISRMARGWQSPRKGLRILMYHAVGSDIPGDPKKLFNIRPDLFQIHINTLKNNKNINLVPLTANNKSYDSTDVAITFDDGYRDNLYIVAPLLTENNIPFTVFVTSDFIASNDSLYLNKNELRELIKLPGVTIGSHGKTHSRLTCCTNAKLKNELVSSKLFLEDLLGIGVKHLSYPHGDVDARVRNAAIDAGYTLGATSYFNINHAEQDLLMLNRTNIISYDSRYSLTMKVEGDWDWYSWHNSLRRR